MSKTEQKTSKQKESKVVKLKIAGAEATVNTIENSTQGDRISLVCPFPALEVHIPVSLGEDRQGTIQRIAVEEDKETGLPRLRLSISAETAPSNAEFSDDPEGFRPVEDEDILSSELYDAPYEALDNALAFQDSEPAWIDCSNLPSPDEFSDHMRSRNRFKVAKRAAWLTVLAVLVCGGYVAERVGLIDVNTVRSHIAGFSIDDLVLGEPQDEATQQEGSRTAAETTPSASDQAVVAPEVIAVNAVPERENNTKEKNLVATGNAENPEVVATSVERQDTAPAHQEPTVEQANPMVIATSGEGEDKVASQQEAAAEQTREPQVAEAKPTPQGSSEANVLLPTRWPVEYATAYRMRDPAGVVVDVPGGLVKREGMLNYKNQTSLIRSAKAIQRETGARFIIFVNGDELPRFITTPQSNGVSLRLYYTKDEAAPSDQIAALE